MTVPSRRAAALIAFVGAISFVGAMGLAACAASPDAPAPPGTARPSATAQNSGATTSPSVTPVDVASYPSFCTDIQSLIAVGDEFGGILVEFREPRDLDVVHQLGGDLSRLYANETSLYGSLAAGPDPRIARDAATILAALPAADGAVADLATGASDWDTFSLDLKALYDSPVFADTSSEAHVASDGLWDIAYATCDNLDG